MSEPKLRVLLLDDETSLRIPLQQFLEKEFDYDVHAVGDSFEALTYVDEMQGHFDVALIDQTLERGSDGIARDGVEVLSFIKESYPNIECIIFTSWGIEDRQKALEAGAFRYIEKPFDTKELAMLVRTAAQQARLRDISKAVVAELDRVQVLSLIQGAAQSLSGADEAAIILLDAMTGKLEVNNPVDGERWYRHFTSRYLTREIIKNGRVASFSNLKATEDLTPAFSAAGYQSLVGIPIPGRVGNLGVLYAYSQCKDHFNEWGRIPVLRTLADQAGLAIANAEAYRELRSHADLQQKLVRVSESLTKTTDESEQLNLVWRFVNERLGVETFFVALYDEDTDLLRFPLIYDENVQRQLDPAELGQDPVTWGITGHAIKKGVELNWATEQEQIQQCRTHGITPKRDGKPCRSCFYLPIYSRTRVIGTLSIQAYRDQAFSPVQLIACRALGAQLSAALENGRVLAETQRREERLDLLERSLLKIRGEDDPAAVPHQAVRLAAQLVQCDAGCWLVNRANLGELEAVSLHDLPTALRGGRINSGEGLAGWVAGHAKSRVMTNYAEWPEREVLFADIKFKALAAVPLQVAGAVEGVLLVGRIKSAEPLNPSDMEILERFASQVVSIQHTAQLLSREQRMSGRLEILHRISDYIQAARELETVLHVVLTGITAGYGLGLNRAALFLMGADPLRLVGRIGIGPMSQEEADDIWNDEGARQRDEFGNYLRLLENGRPEPTSVDRQIRDLVLPIAPADLLARALSSGECARLENNADLEALPLPLLEALQPAAPLLIAPLKSGGQPIGLLLADNKFTRTPLTPDLVEAVLTFVNTAAIAIQNAQLLKEADSDRAQLRSLYAASNKLVSAAGKPSEILHDIVERGRAAAMADGASMVLMDQARHVLYPPIMAGDDRPMELEDLIRANGLSMRVMTRQAEYEKIEDASLERQRINPSLFWRRIRAALCLPVDVQGERLGVMWFHYGAPRRFSLPEIQAYQFYVNQAALAYDNARRLTALEHLRQAAIDLAKASDLVQVRKQIVEHARRVMDAKAALFWPYDDARDTFLVDQCETSGFSPELEEQFRRHPPRSNGVGVTEMVLNEGWHDISNVDSAAELDESRRTLLLAAGAQSLRGQLLVVGPERIGVFYIYYDRPRDFGRWETDTMRSFSAHAALALQKERLVAQLNRTRSAIRSVAKTSVLGKLDHVLTAIASESLDVLKGDAITLYAYDPEYGEFIFPPALAGVYNKAAVLARGYVERNSTVGRVFDRDEAYVAYDVQSDPFFAASRFARGEQIRSVVATPLRTREGKVGVLFVNYRSLHSFVGQELEDIDLFADQAAIAIRNALLYGQTRGQAAALEALNKAGEAITGVLELQDTLDQIVRQALVLVGSDECAGCLSHLSLKIGNYLRFTAASSPEMLARFRSQHGDIDLNSTQVGITGRVARTHEPLNVQDVHEYQAQGHSYIVLDQGTCSELCVPILIGRRLIGVINVEHPQCRAFSNEDRKALESLAATAGIAIQNARLYEQQRIVGEISRETARQLDFKAFLEALFSKLVGVFWDRRVAVYPSLATYDPKTQVLKSHLTRYYRPEPGIVERRLDGPGLIPLVARTLKPYYERDVSREGSPYYPLREGTGSEIAVPVIYGGQLLGVLDIESSLVEPFEDEDVQLLETIADQVATILNAIQQYDDLKRTQHLVDARTSLAGLGMVGTVFRHTTDAGAQKIEEASQFVRKELEKDGFNVATAKSWLDLIERAVRQIKEKPVTLPLRAEEGVSSVGVNRFLTQRIKRMWSSEPYQSCRVVFDLQLPDTATVRASEEWLRCVLEILIDNAIEAMAGLEHRLLVISSRASKMGDRVEITVADSGRGIPQSIREQLLVNVIDKPQGAKGLGVGLLMAKMILETYSGEIGVSLTGPQGTTMLVSLPLEQGERP